MHTRTGIFVGTIHTQTAISFVPAGSTPGITPIGFGNAGQSTLKDGLMDTRSSFNDPYLNRFLQPDTIIPNLYNPQSLNRYSYVFNNPINYVDPDGHRACIDYDANGKCIVDPDWGSGNSVGGGSGGGTGGCGNGDSQTFNYKGKTCKLVPVGNWHLSKYMMATTKDLATDKNLYSFTHNSKKVTVCNQGGGGCEKLWLPFRFLYGSEGIAMQGTGVLPDGRTIYGANFIGQWTYTPNHLYDYWNGTAKFFWGQGKVDLQSNYTAAVGPDYVGSMYYIPSLVSKGFDGVFDGSDRGGAINNGRIDVYVGQGYAAVMGSTFKNGDYETYKLVCDK